MAGPGFVGVEEAVKVRLEKIHDIGKEQETKIS